MFIIKYNNMANINNHTLEIYVNGIPIDLFDDGVMRERL